MRIATPIFCVLDMLAGMDEPREPKPDERDPAIEPYPNGYTYPTPPAISDEERKRYDEIAARLPKPDRRRARRRRR